MRVFMTGGSGLIGSAVAQALVDRGDRVVILSRAMRRGPEGTEYVGGRTSDEGPWCDRLEGCDAVVHLGGHPMGRWSWTDAHGRAVWQSRVAGTRTLVGAIAALPPNARPRILLSASTVDRYPFDDTDTRYAEGGAAGDHYFGRLAEAWEAEAFAARAHGLRVVAFRHGVVLGHGERGYRQLTSAVKLLYRGPCGSGEQWLSWVHVDDVALAYLHALDQSLEGPVNVVAPGAIRQSDFARAVSGVLHREPWSGISEERVRAHLGPFADVLVHGRRAIPLALERSGFRFRRFDLPAALAASLEGDGGPGRL
jgi:uncharacterized protein